MCMGDLLGTRGWLSSADEHSPDRSEPPCVSASVCVRTPASLHQFRHQAFASSFCNNLNAYFCKKKSSPISTPYFTIVFTKKSSYSISSYYGIVLCSDSSMTISVNNSSHRVGIIPHQKNISPLYCYFANTWKVFAHNFKWNSDPPLNLKERRWWQRCSQHGTLLLSTTSTPPRS